MCFYTYLYTHTTTNNNNQQHILWAKDDEQTDREVAGRVDWEAYKK